MLKSSITNLPVPPDMATRKRKIVSCAACRVQRKKCSEDCILAPYFPTDDPDKFTVVHAVYGTSYIIKLLQGLKTEQRADAVNNLACEASARVKDPIQGSAGIIHHLRKRISELESQLAGKQEELKNMHSMVDKLVFLGFPMFAGSSDFQDILYPTNTTEDIMYEQLDLPLWEPIQG
ncbi:LOB domain-containing protein 1-like [Cryptomeria japonica]|uniref:LOB domain-containing protein 1-like n=1 Tax=Cryptomeria japonica TaxID=3369 RepID=UPI0027DA5615|nr:LOB domain-containing protein 1-like [Cryptomeria japonica]